MSGTSPSSTTGSRRGTTPRLTGDAPEILPTLGCPNDRPSALAAAVLIGSATAAEALDGRLVNRGSNAPIAGATITVVGSTVTATTDAEGKFSLTPEPRPPFTVIVILPGGQLAKPVVVEKLGGLLTLTVDAAVNEEVTVTTGVAPSIDASPGAALTVLSSRDIALRVPANLMGAVEVVPGVNQVSEGQAAVPAIRGLARGRTLILIDGSRVTSERRVGPSATFMDPVDRRRHRYRARSGVGRLRIRFVRRRHFGADQAAAAFRDAIWRIADARRRRAGAAR